MDVPRINITIIDSMEYGTIEELLSGLAPTVKTNKRTVRNNNWDKFYTLYAFNFIKYHKLCAQFPLTNRYKLRQQCYVLEDGEKQPLGDERNILRYKALNGIRSRLAHYVSGGLCTTQGSSVVTEYNNFTYYREMYMAEEYNWCGSAFNGKEFVIEEVELKGTWQLSLRERYLRHWLALKYVERGTDIETACEKAINARIKGL